MRLLEAAPGPKYKAALSTAYGPGLRVSEVVAGHAGRGRNRTTAIQGAHLSAAAKPASSTAFGRKAGSPVLRQQEKLCYKGCTLRIILETVGGFGPLRHIKTPHGQR